MAFSFTVITPPVPDDGGKRVTRGTFTNTGGSTGGEIVTSLAVVEWFDMTHTGSTVVASTPSADETFPLTNTNGSVTVVTVADTSGLWEAKGY